MAEVKNYRYESAVSMVKTHGLLSIIFGGLGAFTGLIMMGLFALAIGTSYNEGDAIGFFLLFICTILFWMLPHIYLIIAGVTLQRLPEPRIVKILTIINLVIGIFWNLVLLVFAIISLTQLNEYEDGYRTRKTAK